MMYQTPVGDITCTKGFCNDMSSECNHFTYGHCRTFQRDLERVKGYRYKREPQCLELNTTKIRNHNG